MTMDEGHNRRWNCRKVFLNSIILCILLHVDKTHSFVVIPIIPKSTPSPSIQRHDFQYVYSACNTHIKSTDPDTDTNTDTTDTENAYEYDDSEAESQFGTKEYWDEMYQGYGDFSSEEYSWYFGFGTVKPYWMEYMPNALLPPKHRDSDDNANDDSDGMDNYTNMPKILTPGVGNDPTLLDLYQFGYKDITAFDYSRDAIERQRELLEYDSSDTGGALEDIKLYVMDARDLREQEIASASASSASASENNDDDNEESSVSWTDYFDIIFEKGALDAIYLSGPEQGNVQLAVKELTRVIKPGGYFMSISGVVPEKVRREMFHADKGWEWIRDGSDDLKAGVFVWKRNEKSESEV